MEKKELSQREQVEALYGPLPKNIGPAPQGNAEPVGIDTLRKLAKSVAEKNNIPVAEVLERVTKQVRGLEQRRRDDGTQDAILLEDVERALEHYFGPEGRAVRARTAAGKARYRKILEESSRHSARHAELLKSSGDLSAARKARREESKARAEKAVAAEKKPA